MTKDRKKQYMQYGKTIRPDGGYKTKKTKSSTSFRVYTYRLFIPVASTFFISEKHKSRAGVRL